LPDFAYCNWFKPRPAYRFSAEDSIYLAPHANGPGTGTRCCWPNWCSQAERVGVRKLIAVIGDSANTGSIGVHRAPPVFKPVGVLASCGWKFDRWLDVVLMEKPLGLGDSRLRRNNDGHEKQDNWRRGWPFWEGPLGLHRFYLHGLGDWKGWLLPIPSALGICMVSSASRNWARTTLGQLAAGAPAGLHHCRVCASRPSSMGLMTPEQWNAAIQPRRQSPNATQRARPELADDRRQCVLSLLIGTTILMASIVFSFQRYFEHQIAEARKISQ
jgi:hypothetical protein